MVDNLCNVNFAFAGVIVKLGALLYLIGYLVPGKAFHWMSVLPSLYGGNGR
jgi:hypothetical protein